MSQYPQVGDYALHRWIGRTIRRGTGGALQCLDTEFCSIHVEQFRQPDRAVSMQLERLGSDLPLDGGYQRGGALGRQQSARVFDVQRIDEWAGGKLTGPLGVVRVVVDGTECEHERSDDVFTAAVADHARAGDVAVGVI